MQSPRGPTRPLVAECSGTSDPAALKTLQHAARHPHGRGSGNVQQPSPPSNSAALLASSSILTRARPWPPVVSLLPSWFPTSPTGDSHLLRSFEFLGATTGEQSFIAAHTAAEWHLPASKLLDATGEVEESQASARAKLHAAWHPVFAWTEWASVGLLKNGARKYA